ncbi:MAG: hypothetical protein V4564_11695 [Pseudomonadota bacterium]|uniref:hypothetical protein n=1 Tax=Sphingomonas sp. ERG5 TaxID=1381597 RepID=UPI00054C344A|nr:hypothetical protein [Sphingomonas sp. ERG5]
MDFLKAGTTGLFLLIASGGVAHADKACLIEGTMMSEQIKDCTQTSMSVPAAEYAAQCTSNTEAFKQMGGTMKATVLNACPAKAQAACVGLFGQPATAYYYARDPKSLAATKSSCIAQRGKWVANP